MFWVICDRLAKGEIVLLHHSDEYCKIKYVQCSGYHLINCHCLHKQPSVFHSPSLSSWLSVPLLLPSSPGGANDPELILMPSSPAESRQLPKKMHLHLTDFQQYAALARKKEKKKKTWVLNRNYKRMLIHKATGGWQKHRSSKLNGLKKKKNLCYLTSGNLRNLSIAAPVQSNHNTEALSNNGF